MGPHVSSSALGRTLEVSPLNGRRQSCWESGGELPSTICGKLGLRVHLSNTTFQIQEAWWVVSCKQEKLANLNPQSREKSRIIQASGTAVLAPLIAAREGLYAEI